MVKGSVVTDSIAIVGMIAIAALMITRAPGMITDMRDALSQESVNASAVVIANRLTSASSSTDNKEFIHKLPTEVPYTLTVKDGYVTVEIAGKKAVSKTLSTLTFGPDTVSTVSITKNGIKKVA